MYDSNTVEQEVSPCTEQSAACPRGYLTGTILISLAKAAVDDPPLLILKSLSPAHSITAVDPARSILR